MDYSPIPDKPLIVDDVYLIKSILSGQVDFAQVVSFNREGEPLLLLLNKAETLLSSTEDEKIFSVKIIIPARSDLNIVEIATFGTSGTSVSSGSSCSTGWSITFKDRRYLLSRIIDPNQRVLLRYKY